MIEGGELKPVDDALTVTPSTGDVLTYLAAAKNIESVTRRAFTARTPRPMAGKM